MTALDRVRAYLAAREARQLLMLGGSVHSVATPDGEFELTLGDLDEVARLAGVAVARVNAAELVALVSSGDVPTPSTGCVWVKTNGRWCDRKEDHAFHVGCSVGGEEGHGQQEYVFHSTEVCHAYLGPG